MSHSDSQDQDEFQILEYQHIELEDPQSPEKYKPNDCKYDNNKNSGDSKNSQLQYTNPTLSCIRYNKILNENIFKIEITSSQSKIDMNFLQSQFYYAKISRNGQTIRQKIQRRYSDFDLLFEILEKKYPGFIFPAFPEKGILSYVKTKVSVTKDDSYLKNRIKMVERFLMTILNDQKFNIQKCVQIKKFFSKDQEYGLFKNTSRQELNRSKNIVDSTWSFVKSYFKMNQTSKYASIVQQIRKQKQPFEQLAQKTHQFFELINDQIQANRTLTTSQGRQLYKKLLPSFANLKRLAQSYTKDLQPVCQQLAQLQFMLFCENEDFMMILKKIQMIEHMKQSQQNIKSLIAIEEDFIIKRQQIQYGKKLKIQHLKKQFKQVVERVNQIQRGPE